MARFWNVGKANAEITRLEAEVAKLTKERDEAAAAVEANNSEAVAGATQLESDLATAKQSISTLTAERDAAVKQLSANADAIKALNEKLAGKDEEVKIQVARQVQQTQSQLGAPPVPTPPAATKTATTQVSGMQKVLAAAREDLKKAGYVHPSER